ncbi:MAG TPA: XdhC family protein [Isosphaeraceae bacterium]|jgi:xanthine dehydrogenase accessory factor
MRDLLRHLTDGLERGREALLCQVVQTKGSTPQKAGALMLVEPDGGQLGTLGGGCVEAEVKQKALRRLGQPGAELHTFILDHDYAWADGLICGGKMVILAEALRGPAALAYYRAYRDLLERGRGFTEAVALEPERCGLGAVGARFLFDPEGRPVAGWPAGEPPAAVREQVVPLAERPRAAARGGVALLPTLPRIRLIVVGAGHVGQAVAELAARADFDVWVVDDRRQYASAERFPMAERLVVGPFEQVLPALEVTPQTYALIVTRGHGHDQEALYHLAPTAAPYVGLIGSRRKIRLIFDGLRHLGIPEPALARVSAPVGLDIGSQTVAEIAVSIVAELIARRNKGQGPKGKDQSDDEAETAETGSCRVASERVRA